MTVQHAAGPAVDEPASQTVDGYVAELRRALRGPRRATADLLTEARDGLVDAAEAYQGMGLSRTEAEHRAVLDFGEIRAIAPEYQAELGLTQARRTALLVCAVITGQTALAEYAWRTAAGAGTWNPPTAYAVLAGVVDWTSYLTVLVGLLVAFGCRRGVRLIGVWAPLVRATGVGAIAVCAFFAVAGLALSAFSPLGLSLPAQPLGLAMIALSWSAPWAVALSGRRCLRASPLATARRV